MFILGTPDFITIYDFDIAGIKDSYVIDVCIISCFSFLCSLG